MEEQNNQENKSYIIRKVREGFTYMVFRNDRNGKTFYKIGVTQKDFDGQQKTHYVPVMFKQGVEVADRTKIKINTAIENLYTKGYDVIFSYRITDFENLSESIQEYEENIEQAGEVDLPW